MRERRKNPEKIAKEVEQRREWNKKNPGKNNARRIKHLYGLTVEEWQRRVQEPCHICKKTSEQLGGVTMHIDHDHKTGAIRGTLCPLHNKGLGHFQDDPELMLEATKYLFSWKQSYPS